MRFIIKVLCLFFMTVFSIYAQAIGGSNGVSIGGSGGARIGGGAPSCATGGSFGFVQDSYLSNTSGTAHNAVQLSNFSAGLTHCNLVYAVFNWTSASATLASCSDGVNTYSAPINFRTGSLNVAMCYACQVAGGSTTGITGTLAASATATFFGGYAQEWSGSAASCLDTSVTASYGAGTSASVNIVTATTNELIANVMYFSGNAGTVTVGSGFSTNGTFGGSGNSLTVSGTEQQVATTATTYPVAISWSSSVSSVQLAFDFKHS